MFFTVEKIEQQLKEIRRWVAREILPVPAFKYYEGDCPQASRPDFDDSAWPEFRVGDTWGGYDVTAWFRARIQIPAHFAGEKVILRLLVGPRDGGGSTAETLLYLNGKPLQGIDVWHEEAWLPPEELTAGEISIALKAWSGVIGVPERRRFKTAELAVVDEAAETYYYLVKTLVQAVKVLEETDLRRVELLQAVNESVLCIDWFKPGSGPFYRSVEVALRVLLEKTVAFQDVAEIKPSVTGIGHAHIDMAWLWRLKDTREKASRTFSTALHLMRQYPDYVFLHSSPQLYQYIKVDYPEIYARIQEMAASGRWEVEGGMWVEADTNLPSGESLVRQFLFGKRFAREEFGVDMQTLWLPDVFGYSAALPQIMEQCGIRYFLTSKISWSQYNRFPNDTFHWRGIDGTEVLTHFVTTPEKGSRFFTYNGTLDPAEVKGSWDRYQQKPVNDELLILYGWGDGGGGPTQEMLESARALKNVPGLPSVRLGKAGDFFERLECRVQGKNLPVWDGELYLEYHRGTYTSQARSKRANRKAEVLYHDAEWLSSLADILSGGGAYPDAALRKGWELILLNQFHDILPGSSIRQVYEDSQVDYAEAETIGLDAVERAVETIVGEISADQDGIAVFNALAWPRDGLVELPMPDDQAEEALLQPDGALVSFQVTETDGEKRLLVPVRAVPGLGYRSYSLQEFEECQPAAEASARGSLGKTAFVSREADRWQPGGGGIAVLPGVGPAGGGSQSEVILVTPERLENRYYRIELNEKGQIASLLDKTAGRQVLAAGQSGNVLQAFEDRPMNFDAWDIDVYYQEKMREVADLVEAAVEESGPLRGVLRLRWKFYDSEITQRLTIYRDSPRIDFRTRIDWHEHQVLLKAAFPVDIRATRATYDIQFGSIERPTHWNTSWDSARFEVVGHKWVDLSEGSYGVSLLNDCKYGHDVKDNVIRLTLLKSGIHPDETADQGWHEFTYSLLPHCGSWRESGVVQQAYDLNMPLRAERLTQNTGGSLPADFQLARLDAGNVILETVKKAEEGDAWIFRVYECYQSRSQGVHLEFGVPVGRAVECNLLETGERPVSYDRSRVTFDIRPFQIKTFKVWFEPEE